MREIRKKSAVPFYGAAAVWAVYCLFLPLFKFSHFLFLIIISAVVFAVLSKVIPDSVTYIEEEPETTGDSMVDELLETGRKAVRDLKDARASLGGTAIAEKTDRIIELTEKIFDNLRTDKSNYSQVKRFADYFLPATLKLLNAYIEMDSQNVSGENISGTISRIEEILDTTVTAYEKQLDALFFSKAIDIETDISVMEGMMKNQGLSGSDFELHF